jgi:hypothetical protein
MQTFLILTTIVAILLVTAAIGIEFLAGTDPSVNQQLTAARTLIWSIGANAWMFAKPLLQLIAVLLILEWLFSRVGVRLRLNEIRTNWNVQTFIAGVIISTFCIAVLADIQAVSYLKDVVLIVIGFYFGTRARTEDRPGPAGQVAIDTPSPPGSPTEDVRDQTFEDAGDRPLQPQPKSKGQSFQELREQSRQKREAYSETFRGQGESAQEGRARMQRGRAQSSDD